MKSKLRKILQNANLSKSEIRLWEDGFDFLPTGKALLLIDSITCLSEQEIREASEKFTNHIKLIQRDDAKKQYSIH